eukprot:CAMPEP_0178923244 /NCGR_PEP_ID=MMETSP0786-20121207/16610_1 /TAXON_ID=186022 /ORGANISM="Thalassionema frauenfeldii, Strain CCMP 1798" /LENGTH=405 /DNA_ID=CAMNT_0020597715 /DNA_START=37 /DNA_END=1254 /DNA_ORIENTATION=-
MTEQKNYVAPRDNDVLCGRGKVAFEHPGNQKLRRKIAEELDSYNSCQSRLGRTSIIRETIHYIRVEQGGRFLKADKNGQWYDGGMQAAKGRVSTAFRDARVPNKVKCMKVLREKKTKTVTSEQADQRNNSLISASKNSGVSSRRDSLSSFINLMLGQAGNKRGSLGFCLPDKVGSMKEEKENPAKSQQATTRRNSLSSLSFVLKNTNFASRRDSLSSFVNLMLGQARTGKHGSVCTCVPNKYECKEIENPGKYEEVRLTSLPSAFKNSSFASRRDSLSSFAKSLICQSKTTKRESIDSNMTFGSYAPSISKRGSLNSTISIIDSELLNGLEKPDFAAGKTNIASRKNSMDLDFGGRNFFDITEQQVSDQNAPSRAEETERSSGLPEDFFGNMISFVAPSALAPSA